MTIELEIKQQLAALLQPEFLEVDNESHMHSVPANSETHFRVVVVSDVFAGMRSVARHQMIYKALEDYLAGPVHALALHTYDAHQWQQRQASVPQSPDCLGGSKEKPATTEEHQ